LPGDNCEGVKQWTVVHRYSVSASEHRRRGALSAAVQVRLGEKAVDLLANLVFVPSEKMIVSKRPGRGTAGG
jgi:hypothetical protein